MDIEKFKQFSLKNKDIFSDHAIVIKILSN